MAKEDTPEIEGGSVMTDNLRGSSARNIHKFNKIKERMMLTRIFTITPKKFPDSSPTECNPE
jgi:hypothetical protein